MPSTRSALGILSWRTRYRLRNYVRDSLWLVPTAAVPLALMLFPLARWIDDQTQWNLLGFGSEGARALLGTLAPSTLTLIVLILSTTLLAVQLASSQFSPRLIAGLLSNRPVKFCLSTFVVAYVFSVGALGRIETRVPQLLILLAIASTLLSVGAAFFLVDYIAKELRPVQMLARTANAGRSIIEQVYPITLKPGDPGHALEDSNIATDARLPANLDTFTHARRSGVLLAIDVNGLFDLAKESNCTIELIPRVGDFVARGDPVFLVDPKIQPAHVYRLRQSVAIGHERTPEQDPMFVFRILVDVAIKALSAAINDPTTAVLAIDQIHHLLRQVGLRRLDSGIMRDAAGLPRLIYHTPNWEDFVSLAVTEIRLFGKDSIQVARRLGAMLENLAKVVPPDRVSALKNEILLLHRGVEQSFSNPEDRSLARVGDSQGM